MNPPDNPDAPDSGGFARRWAIESARLQQEMAEAGIRVGPIPEEAWTSEPDLVVTFVPRPSDDSDPTPKPSAPPK